MTVQILLATYNGARFVREQVLSVLQQSFTDLEILVADDGSTDETLAIIEQLAAEFPGKVRILFRSRVGGAAQNFMRLIDSASAPYVMCCDQDDVWLPHKIALLLDHCRKAEADHPGAVLIHSDLIVVDVDLRVISRSMFGYLNIDPTQKQLGDLMLNNIVTGCALMMNRALTQKVQGADADDMIMHDWWIALVASAFGVVQTNLEPTVLYRQHDSNAVGATGAGGLVYFARRLLDVAGGGRLSKRLRKSLRQADAFIKRYGRRLRPADYEAGSCIAALASQSSLRLRYSLVRHRILKEGLLRNLVTLIVV